HAAERGDLARGTVNSFLRDLAGVAFDPLPLDLVRVDRAVKSRPPILIRLAFEAPAHRLDDVARVGQDVHVAWLAQEFEANGRGGDLGLLVRGRAEVAADGTPHVSITQERNGCGARRLLPVAEA